MSYSGALQRQANENAIPCYRSYGREQWPEHAWLSYQFRRTLGYAQLGGASVSECMQVAYGVHDVLGQQDPPRVVEYARSKGVNIPYREVAAAETGADHCQHDNPTLGSDIVVDWLAHQLGINQKEIVKDGPRAAR